MQVKPSAPWQADEPLGERFQTQVEHFFGVVETLFPMELDEFTQAIVKTQSEKK